jgi:Set1/Ash2 histone methyltransferase complex subunit ASH2
MSKSEEETKMEDAEDSSTPKEAPPRKKRLRTSPPTSRGTTPTPEAASAAAITAAAAAAAAQAASACGLTGLYGLLTTLGGMPSADQVKQAAIKAVNDAPPFVHLSNRDSAPQLKIEDFTKVIGGMQGYRMARASHGVSQGTFYFEVLVLSPPTIQDIQAKLPPNVRLGSKLQKQLQDLSKNKDSTSSHAGGNLRIGWSMRTGDLQAPVGYDKWSYGLRDIAGSRIHDSKREDNWGGEPFGPGDVVGFCISLSASDGNHIRFFKNGDALGNFVVRKGKREGGAAFEDVIDGTYYPAISSYMGGTCLVNFGPHFIFSPRSLPSGLKVKPMSQTCPPPLSPQEAVNAAMKEKIFKKTDDSLVTRFREAIEIEATIRQEAYKTHMAKHVEQVRKLRQERNLSTSDLPAPANEKDNNGNHDE